MHKHNELLNRLGRTRDIAKALNIVDPHVSKWRRSGIAKRYIPCVVALARANGYEPTLSDFFDV
tara:strand:+ start:4292 stop:4483 length:192 start_codon:yes stop_codon:yes gene_type:complete